MKSIIPSTGDAGAFWPASSVLPQGMGGLLSASDWTVNNEGLVQQTFLGASIINFNVNAGFGDSSSTLSVELIDDEYNKSDETGLGFGDDVYHNGVKDKFNPPAVGSPVFFKFGKNFATIQQAWRKPFDDAYGFNTIPSDSGVQVKTYPSLPIPIPENEYMDIENTDRGSNTFTFVKQPFLSDSYYSDSNDKYDGRGSNHFVFGGILQSAVQTKADKISYSVQVVDPREILSNAAVILNNYNGSVFNNKNFFNVYGFLEYDVSDSLMAQIKSLSQPGFIIGGIEKTSNWVTSAPFSYDKKDNRLEKVVNPLTGDISYFGNDMYRFPPVDFGDIASNPYPEFFPMTGAGFSRRSSQGIPWYRVRQALDALFNYNGFLPQEYMERGFGGVINFRGFNYVVDFTGLPLEKIPQMYFLDFDQIDMLSLAQELCDVISHDLFVSLLPVIDHPACSFLYHFNKSKIKNGEYGSVIAGIIRIDAIDRSKPPKIGAIKSYLEDLSARGVEVETMDLGYELSNVTTDKIVTGAQEVEMYYFSSNKDRDTLQARRKNSGLSNGCEYLQSAQWLLETSLKQQILPFYGFLGKDCVSIPRGFGAYQQIMLDTSSLNAEGVGNYYIATEMELRSALVSYEAWASFLNRYNDVYLEEVTENYLFHKHLAMFAKKIDQSEIDSPFDESHLFNREFAVSVPRCVFESDKNYVNSDNLPASPCAPPYGYPLYYKRAEMIGVQSFGVVNFYSSFKECATRLETLKQKAEEVDGLAIARMNEYEQYRIASEQLQKQFSGRQIEDNPQLMLEWQQYLEAHQKFIEASTANNEAAIVSDVLQNMQRMSLYVDRLAKKQESNAKKIYEFIRQIASECLGRKFLVKIPKKANVNYSNEISIYQGSPQTFNIRTGPFGFMPRKISSEVGGFALNSARYNSVLLSYQQLLFETDLFEHYLDDSSPASFRDGALKSSFNPISDEWEFNYQPSQDGGYLGYDLFDRNLSYSKIMDLRFSKIPSAQLQALAPLDMTNFSENGRIKSYVRFDNSQYLNFSSIAKDSVFHQAITPEGFIPIPVEELENLDGDNQSSANRISLYGDLTPTCTFIKCEIDPSFYLTPKIVKRSVKVFGREVVYLNNFEPPIPFEEIVTQTDSIGNQIQCKRISSSRPYSEPIFYPAEEGGSDGTEVVITEFDKLSNGIIPTNKESLDDNYVYALITIPGVITPYVDMRYLDSQSINAVSYKHFLTQDIVKGAPGFEKPASKTNGKRKFNCDKFEFKELTDAQAYQAQSLSNINLADPSLLINVSQPSPVYPDLVCISLLSRERSYGPWVSSSIINLPGDDRVRYSDIGGKVEFVKDENLAPWNYGGYQLMNEAGALQAQFSNSLLLLSERGGFIMPDTPTGLNLAKALKEEGPLVTSISIDVGVDGVKTTVRMDLYTSRFGKLQKQKELAIAQVNRERQKLIDQNNRILRSNALARQSTFSVASSEQRGIVDVFPKTPALIIASAVSNSKAGKTNNDEESKIDSIKYMIGLQAAETVKNTLSLLEDENSIRKIWNQTAAVPLSEMFKPFATEALNLNMPTTEYSNVDAKNYRIK